MILFATTPVANLKSKISWHCPFRHILFKV
jgi:hypothetical protein